MLFCFLRSPNPLIVRGLCLYVNDMLIITFFKKLLFFALSPGGCFCSLRELAFVPNAFSQNYFLLTIRHPLRYLVAVRFILIILRYIRSSLANSTNCLAALVFFIGFASLPAGYVFPSDVNEKSPMILLP